MRGLVLPIVFALGLGGCAVTPDKAQSSSNKDLCRVTTVVAPWLTKAAQEEIVRRGVNCNDYAAELAAERQRAQEQQRAAAQARQDRKSTV